jgi:hypothetical protein
MELSSFLLQFRGILFLFVIVWGIFSVLHLFHFGFSVVWRFILLLLFIFFVLLHYPFLIEELNQLTANYLEYFKKILKEIVNIFNYIDFFLYFFWPIILIYSFFSAKEKKALDFIKIFLVITLMFWLIQFVKDNPFVNQIIQKYFIKYF